MRLKLCNVHLKMGLPILILVGRTLFKLRFFFSYWNQKLNSIRSPVTRKSNVMVDLNCLQFVRSINLSTSNINHHLKSLARMKTDHIYLARDHYSRLTCPGGDELAARRQETFRSHPLLNGFVDLNCNKKKSSSPHMCKGFSLRFHICPHGKCGIKVHRNNCTVRLTTLEHIRRAVSPHTWPTLTFTIHPSLAKKSQA